MENSIGFDALLDKIRDKIRTRAARIGIPEKALTYDMTGPCSAALSLLEPVEGGPDRVTGIMQLSSDPGCEQFIISVSADAVPGSGVSGSETRADGSADGRTELIFDPVNEDAVKSICLFAADAVQFEFERYESIAEPFECCSRQYTCSIKGECVHPDQLYAKACRYRSVLASGNKY